MKKFFVVSLPRTGTKSLCKMAKICGLSIKHVPGLRFNSHLSNYDFFADTPCYTQSFVETIIQNENFDPHFIYIDKDFEDIFSSWKRIKLYSNYIQLFKLYSNISDKQKMSQSMIFDIESYNESFGDTFITENNYMEIFDNHKNQIFSKIKKYNKKLLIYKFSDGWEPFCDFIGVEIPNVDIPHINKDTMFEKID